MLADGDFRKDNCGFEEKTAGAVLGMRKTVDGSALDRARSYCMQVELCWL